jgi:hypothetical protein
MKPSYLVPIVLVLVAADNPAPGKLLVLLLDNFQIVEGQTELVGETYRVHQGKDVRSIPRKRVLFADESRAAVYRHLLVRAGKTRIVDPAAQAFVGQVQPILMNTCAKCHCQANHPSAFKLTRVAAGYANSEATGQNVVAAMAWLNRAELSASPLLVKAITAHGGQRQPALYGRAHPAFRNLEAWAIQAAGSTGSAKPAVTASSDPYDPALFNQPADPTR